MNEELEKAKNHCLRKIQEKNAGHDAIGWAEVYATLMGWKSTSPNPFWAPVTYGAWTAKSPGFEGKF